MNVSYRIAGLGLGGLYSTELTEIAGLFGLQCGEADLSLCGGARCTGEGERGGAPNTNGGFGCGAFGSSVVEPRPGLPWGTCIGALGQPSGSSGTTSSSLGMTCVTTDWASSCCWSSLKSLARREVALRLFLASRLRRFASLSFFLLFFI